MSWSCSLLQPFRKRFGVAGPDVSVFPRSAAGGGDGDLELDILSYHMKLFLKKLKELL
jgi:hypothetical protein